MTEMCFVFDLRCLPPPFLTDLKQSLLKLANLYDVSPPPLERLERPQKLPPLRDRLRLGYVSPKSDEINIVYSPHPTIDFSLRDFHRAVNSLPEDVFEPQIDDFGVELSVALNQIYDLERHRHLGRKVIVLTSFLPRDVDLFLEKAILPAYKKRVWVDFLVFEQISGHFSTMKENTKSFQRCISHFQPIAKWKFQPYLADIKELHGLVHLWLRELMDDFDMPIRACFNFKNNLVKDVNYMYGYIRALVNPTIDDIFHPWKTCRCHGVSLEDAVRNKTEPSSCSVTGHNLDECDVIENSVKVGESTILSLPSVPGSMKLKCASSTIHFDVLERSSLGSISEGFIIGASHVVIPQFLFCPCSPAVKVQKEIFQGLCNTLHALNQCLVCSSKCNVQTMRANSWRCYYILQPLANGSMLLRRIAGSDEVLHVPDLDRLTISSVSKEIENSVSLSLSKVDVSDYNPMLHDSGLHQVLKTLVTESLRFGSAFYSVDDELLEADAAQQKFAEVTSVNRKENPQLEDEVLEANAAQQKFAEVETPQLDLTSRKGSASATCPPKWETYA